MCQFNEALYICSAIRLFYYILWIFVVFVVAPRPAHIKTAALVSGMCQFVNHVVMIMPSSFGVQNQLEKTVFAAPYIKLFI